MVRKLIKRTLLLGAALVGISIVALVVTGYLACQEPGFYAGLRDPQELTDADRAEARQIVESFEQWAMKSTSRQRANQRNFGDAKVQAYDPQNDTHTVRLTQTQLNAQLASQRVGDLSAPRVRLLQGRMQVGAEIGSKGSSYVFSADLQPTVNPDGLLRLDIQGSRLGKVPFPLRWVLSLLAQAQDRSTNELKLDLSGPTPVFILDLSRGKSRSIKVKSIQCVDGAIAIEFQAPIPNQDRQSIRLSWPGKTESQR